MDPQIQTCVVDAATLTDHIHGIKKLVYDHQIRLIVPLNTAEGVEKTYQKSIKPKPESKEPVRPKSGGKPVKVYPTFDINPRITTEFLDRCRIGGSQSGVEFQQEAEDYTPWKNLKEQEEKQKAPDAKPAGYAAALLAKLKNKEDPVQALTGPAKPKLVARSANGPTSPWKKSVLTISAEGVPIPLRPILGYMLWRLYERETYSFVKDASILLTNDKEIGAAARKLGINVQSVDTLLNQQIVQHVIDTDAGFWREIGHHFDILPSSRPVSRNGHTKLQEEVVSKTKTGQVEPGQPSALRDLQEHGVENPDSQGHEILQQVTADAHDSQSKIIAPTQRQDLSDNSEELVSVQKERENGNIDKTLDGPAQQSPAEVKPPRPRAWADVVSNRIRPIEERYPSPVIGNLEHSDAPRDSSDTIDPLAVQVNQEKANTIADWLKMVNANMDGEIKPSANRANRRRSPKNKKMEKSSPLQEPSPKPFRPILMQRTPKSSQTASEKARTISEKAHSPSPPPPVQPLEQTEHIIEPTPTQQTEAATDIVETQDKIPADHAQTTLNHRSTDSSASSAQTAPSKDTSVAKTAPFEEPVDSEEEVVVFNPRPKRHSAQQQSPMPVSEGKQSHAKRLSVEEPSSTYHPFIDKAEHVKQSRQLKPKTAPIVIDPDAFGRDFASNPQISHQNGFRRPHSRPVSQNGLLRPVIQNGPPRGGGGARGGRPFIHPQALPPMHNAQHTHLNASVRGGRQNRVPLISASNGENTVNQNTVTMNGQANAHASPRPSPRVSPQRHVLPNGPEPDAGFVLQSGPPRGSTRGRGKLWIP